MSLIRTLALAACCLFTAGARAQAIEPASDWKSADTPHFRINYREALRDQAERVGRAAERAYPRVTQLMGWEPRGKTEILLINQFDQPNGFSTPLPYGIIGVFLAPPDKGELLDNSDWLDLLLTHEFTHTVQLDKVRGAPGILQKVFGRQPYFFPNVFQPSWVVEGLAVYHESDPATGRGRLMGPVFEAWLRAEAQSGFLSLREINADGRSLPPSKAYLYGAYFFEFVARKYGSAAIYQYVDHYSGNPPFYPRLQSSPYGGTGKGMDELWEEFRADLKQQVAQRGERIAREPEVLGTPLSKKQLSAGSVAVLPSGETLAILDDGLHHARLSRIASDGRETVLAQVNEAAELDVAPDGRVLLAQPDVCNWRFLAFDLYRVDTDDGDLHQITHCARLRHAVQAGDRIAALQQQQGRTRLVLLDAKGREERVLWAPAVEVNLVDLAASPDGQRLSVVSKQRGLWTVSEFDLARPDAPPRLLFTHDAPLHGLKHGPAGLEFIAVRDGAFNVWRLQGAEWVKLTHAHTRVVAQSGTQADGSMVVSVVVPGGYELRRIAATEPLQRVAAASTVPASTAATLAATPPDATSALGEAQPYSALRSVYPRSWLPVLTSDRGLTAVGASTFGSDALGWHQYAAALQYETSQKDWQGNFQYLFQSQHLLSFTRELTPRTWKNNDDGEDVTSYDRETGAQWLSMFPWLRLDRRITFGVGAAMKRVDRVHQVPGASPAPRDERLVAALLDYDTTATNWWSEGPNEGQHATLLFESYKPFARDHRGDYDGNVTRLDWRGFLPLGRSVLALRHTEAYAQGRTEPFEVGGAVDTQLQLGIELDNRDISLRGYRGDEPGLRGTSARVTTVEWRTPIADVDRHFMTPAVGLNRVSAAAFFDIGGAWNTGRRPMRYQRGVGVEMLAEVKLLYALGLQLRLGVARGLDGPEDTRGYLTVGRAF
jgi:hypothetical protein